MGKLVLKNGSQVAIIGGGPAGSFFAYFLQKFALEEGLSISTTIFDGKNFLQKGPKGCNLCAGVIANSLNRKLQDEGIFLPEKRIINRVEGYCLHIEEDSLYLSRLEHKKDAISTVFRGNGPRFSAFPETVSFDDFLITLAQDAGAEVVFQPVWNIDLPDKKDDPVSLQFGKSGDLHTFEADLVVGAFGVNTHLAQKIQNLGFGYKPPSTLITYQAEMKLGEEFISQYFGNIIHVYMPRAKNLRYATVIPKGDFVTITLIGKKHARKEIIHEFLALKQIQGKIFPSSSHCACFPRITVSPAKKPYTDRLIMIGDASFSRHYKNGIESAFITAKQAAKAAICSGVDAAAFSTSYYQPAKKMIVYDNYYGRYLFAINDILLALPILKKAHVQLAQKKEKSGSPLKIRSILWYMFTGTIPYQQIFNMTLDFRLQLSLLFNTIGLAYRGIKDYIRKNDRTGTAISKYGPDRE